MTQAPRESVGQADVVFAYQLFLGRSVESQAAVDGFLGRSVDAVARALAGSGEFRTEIAEPLAAGRFVVHRFVAAPPEPLRRWAAQTLPLSSFARRREVDESLNWISLLRSIFNDESFRSSLGDDGLRQRLIAALAPPRSGLTAAEALAADQLPGVADGLRVLACQGMEKAEQGRVRFTSNDPAIFLEPLHEDRTAAFGVLTLDVLDARPRSRGRLYIDEGQGWSERGSIPLHPRRRVHQALVCGLRGVKALRWDPDEVTGEVSIRGLTFSALSPSELIELARSKEGDDAAKLLTLAVEQAAHEQASGSAATSRALTDLLFDNVVPPENDYAAWIEWYDPGGEAAQARWRADLDSLSRRPLISILVPVYETPERLLREMIESVRAQVYPDWTLCIADDGSRSPHVRAVLAEYAAADTRIKVIHRPMNGHIVEASNSALELVEGEWVALLDHDDLLHPRALLAVARLLDVHPDAELIYSDEDKLDSKGERFKPFFKPDFSPDLFRSQNYLNHLTVHRTANIRAVGGWRRGFEGSQDYDLNLRVIERIDPSRIHHIPEVLYHWRVVPGSTALAVEEKDYAYDAGARALREHVARTGVAAQVERAGPHPFYRMRYALPEPRPLVSLIVPTRDRADLLAMCMDSVLSKTDYHPFEVLIVDNGSRESETFALFERLTRDCRVRVLPDPGPFNYSRINNTAVAQSRGAIVGLLNNDVEVIERDWLREMASWAAQDRIGCVGAKLYYPNETIQHAGVVVGLGGVAGHSHKAFERNHPGYFHRLVLAQNISAVTGACLLVRRAVFDEVGGLDEDLQIAFNDVDFCLKVREAGYLNVFTPSAELYHHESVSRGHEDTPEKVERFQREIAFMKQRWGDKLSRDPYYSPNLTLAREDYSLA